MTVPYNFTLFYSGVQHAANLKDHITVPYNFTLFYSGVQHVYSSVGQWCPTRGELEKPERTIFLLFYRLMRVLLFNAKRNILGLFYILAITCVHCLSFILIIKPNGVHLLIVIL